MSVLYQDDFSIIPTHPCSALGAVYYILGIKGAMPILHGSQGCSTFVRYLMIRHFREPVRAAATLLYEDNVILGGRDNLIEGIKNLIRRYNPKLVGVINSSVSEVIGEDIESTLRQLSEHLNVHLVPITKKAIQTNYIEGYNTACCSVLDHTTKGISHKTDVVNIIPGILNPGDIEELKRILTCIKASFIFLSDISKTLDTSLCKSSLDFSIQDEVLENLKHAAASKATITFGYTNSGAAYLKEKYGVKNISISVPIGIYNTDVFIENAKATFEVENSDCLKRERGILLDAMADAVPYVMMKKAAVIGEPGTVEAIVRFICEIGMEPKMIMSDVFVKGFEEKIAGICEQYGYKPTVVANDVFKFKHLVKESEIDIAIGHSYTAPIMKKLKIPMVRAGFPVYDKFGYHRWPIVGYKGSLRLLDMIVNALHFRD